MSKQNRYEFSFNSVIGTRNEQQDSFGIISSAKAIVACVCDGMGGHEGGAVASRTAVAQLINEVSQEINSIDKLSSSDFYIDLLDKMDNAVYQLKSADGRKISAGTTLVSVFITEKSMNWLAVGDSSMYILRNESITRINDAHNYKLRLDEELSRGIISEKEYNQKISKGNALISYIGMGGIDLFNINQVPFVLEHGDVIVLCSDGLTKFLDDIEIKNIVATKTAKKAVDSLMKAFSERSLGKSQDNTTVVIIKIN